MLHNYARGRNARITFIIVGFTLIFTLFANAYQYTVLEKIETGNFEEWELTLTDLLSILAGFTTFVARILFIVFFLMWLRRAYGNLTRIGVKGLEADGWAVGAWFIPFYNLYKPFQIVRDTYEESAMACFPIKDKYRNRPNITILGIWWASFLLSNIVRRILTGSIWETAQTIEELKQDALGGAIGDFMQILPFILLMIIMKRISTFEDRLWEIHQEKPEGVPFTDYVNNDFSVPIEEPEPDVDDSAPETEMEEDS